MQTGFVLHWFFQDRSNDFDLVYLGNQLQRSRELILSEWKLTFSGFVGLDRMDLTLFLGNLLPKSLSRLDFVQIRP